ncbi:dihydrolipoamide acetyltransferase family protein [Pseudomonas sp. DC3200b2]|uniref:dihydrolipoamide acetyltransferase family protein n=1 Tax=Pseudomonas sp. DC3200b2 TaxID=2804669 RepID=UPI003CF1ED11
MNDLTLNLQSIVAPLQQEGTQAVLRTWLKAAGARVAQDEPVAELETDKVVVEVCAPCAGQLQITLQEGQAAAPGAVLGHVSSASAADATQGPLNVMASADTAPSAASNAPAMKDGVDRVAGPSELETRLSPAVRRLLADHDLDPAELQGKGTGRGGRLTRADVVAALAKLGQPGQAADQPAPTSHRPDEQGPGVAQDSPRVAARIPHSPMRRAIAEHMQRSVSTAPHVTAMVEADFSAIIAHRQRHKARFAEQGTALTFTAYFVAAAAQAMAAAPAVNSRWHADELELFEDINIGVGTALGDQGLVVPVIHRVQELSLLGIARRLQAQTEAARAGRLQRAALQGGTFTISNHGVSGTLLATPIIINQPQSAILGVGAVEKRVVIREVDGVESWQARPRAYITLTIDHRVLDGSQANAWLKRFVEVIEGWKDEPSI